jgi:hypothetical protein
MRATLKGLRPYTAIAPLVRLSIGMVRLSVRLVLLCMAGEGAEKLWRALGLVVLVGTAYRAAEAYPIVMAPVSLLLAVLAWRAGARPGPEETEAGEQPKVVPLTAEVLTVALHHVGAPHAHLAVLATHLKTSTARVREGLTGAGIPIEGGVRMKGRGVSTGVKADHFPPLPSPTPAPSEDVVAAGQSNNNNIRVTRSASGAQITVTPADAVVHQV